MRTRAAVSAMKMCCVLAALPFGCAPAQDTGRESTKTIRVFAAASSTTAVCEIKRHFTAATGIEVQASFGSSAALARQVANGAGADVFLSADTKWADDLAEKGLVDQRRDLLGNRLVIIVPDDSKLNVTKPEDLTSSQIIHIAMGEPKSVPAGMYAKRAFEKLGLWDELKPKVAVADDVRIALAYVETGAAEAGIVYATDAAISKKVRIVAKISERLTGPVCYPIVLFRHEKGPTTAAISFYKYLGSTESINVFRKFGFHILDESKRAAWFPKGQTRGRVRFETVSLCR